MPPGKHQQGNGVPAMLTPEEQKAKAKWLREHYAEHYRFKARVYNARKKGIKDPEKHAAEQMKAEAERKATAEYDKTHEYSRQWHLFQDELKKQQRKLEKRQLAENSKRNKARIAFLQDYLYQRELEQKEREREI